ncbi:Uncharacterised protein [Vibrio cholerae]|nr:Uncharacterised protein [Vibrio cholerae]
MALCLRENLLNLALHIGRRVAIGDFNKMGNAIKHGDVRPTSAWINTMYCHGVLFYVIREEACRLFTYLYRGAG